MTTRSLVVAAVLALVAAPAVAQERAPKPVPTKPKVPPQKPKLPPKYDMGEVDVYAKDRKLSLMQFLERASEELERASLEKRSFVPELLKTVDAEQL